VLVPAVLHLLTSVEPFRLPDTCPAGERSAVRNLVHGFTLNHFYKSVANTSIPHKTNNTFFAYFLLIKYCTYTAHNDCLDPGSSHDLIPTRSTCTSTLCPWIESFTMHSGFMPLIVRTLQPTALSKPQPSEDATPRPALTSFNRWPVPHSGVNRTSCSVEHEHRVACHGVSHIGTGLPADGHKRGSCTQFCAQSPVVLATYIHVQRQCLSGVGAPRQSVARCRAVLLHLRDQCHDHHAVTSATASLGA